MAPWDGDDEQDEEEQADEDHEALTSHNDHIIFLIDARSNMHEASPSDKRGRTYFYLALNCAVQVMKNKVIMSSKHMVGITFFGASNTNDPDPTYLWEFQPLQAPGATCIRAAETLINESMFVDFDEKYKVMPATGTVPLRQGILECSDQFRRSVKQKDDYKRVFLLTNEDLPLEKDPDERERIVQVAKDCAEADVVITVYGMNKGDNCQFDPAKFYRTIMPLDGDEFNNLQLATQSGASGFEDLMKRIRKKEFKSRLTRLSLQLSDELAISVQVHNFVQPAPKPTAIQLRKNTQKHLKPTTALLAADTANALDEHEIKTYVEFGGARAYITPTEMSSMKRLSDPGIMILGFKPESCIRDDHTLASPYFIYPDEDRMTGSTVAFAALHAEMLAKRVIAVCRFTRNAAAAPRFSYLVPQQEILDTDTQAQITPPGMHLIQLPFADDVRDAAPHELVPQPRAEPEQVAASGAILDAMALQDYDCRDFENPTLQKHYAGLQAVALKEHSVDWTQKKNDFTMPNTAAIEESAASALESFKELIGGEEELREEVSSKRKANDDGTGTTAAAKKAKVAAAAKEELDASIDWAAEAAADTLERFKLAELKTYLRSEGLPLGGKKADLVQRIKDHFP